MNPIIDESVAVPKPDPVSEEPTGHPDSRMLWLRDLEDLGKAETYVVVEAELASEVLVPGLLEYGGNSIRLRPVTYKPNSQGLYKYILQLRSHDFPRAGESYVVHPGTTEGYVFPEGAIGELVALLSLTVQARFYVLSEMLRVGHEHSDVVHKAERDPLRGQYGPSFDRVIFSELDRNNTHLGPILDKIRRLPSEHHISFAVAADHYVRALRMIGVDGEMVFVRLVSAIEKMMGDQPKDALSAKLTETTGLTKSEQGELKIMLRARRAGARFCGFLQQYSAGFFDGEPTEPPHMCITAESLPATAKAIYGARSAYLHAGDPMYLSDLSLAGSNTHSDPSLGRIWQSRSYAREQKLPYADFFHRLVRHCILARLDELYAFGLTRR